MELGPDATEVLGSDPSFRPTSSDTDLGLDATEKF
jgi:hypothetical protein